MTVRALPLATALLLVAAPARAQSPDATMLWGTLNAWLQLPSHLRILATGQLEGATNTDYQQWITGVGMGYQWKRITREHLLNINPDKESRVVAGIGYEYLATEVPGSNKQENRIVLGITPRDRPAARWLLEDRNRLELRWVNGQYSTRYRNRLTLEHDMKFDGFRMTPYLSAELFFSFNSGTVNEEQYSLGLQFPVKDMAMLDAYYMRQQCTSCAPGDANIIGLTLNWYFHSRRSPDR